MRIGVYTESKQIFGSSLGPQALSRTLGYLESATAIVALAKLSWLLEGDADDQAVQLMLAKLLLPPSTVPIAEDIIFRQGRMIFFPQQVQVVIKHAVLHCKPSDVGRALAQIDLVRLGSSLLSASDLISMQAKRVQREISTTDDLKRITFELLSASYLVRKPLSVNPLLRARQLYSAIPKRPDIASHGDYINLDQLFEGATGISLTDYLRIGIAILTRFLAELPDAQAISNLSSIAFDLRKYLDTSYLQERTIDKFLDLVSKTIPNAKQDIASQSQRELAFDSLPFKASPFLQITRDLYVPISFFYLVEKLTTGAYWILFDHLTATSQEEAKKKLFRFNGILFQEYFADLAKEIARTTQGRGETLALDQPYRVGGHERGQEHKTPDAMFFGPDYAVFIEAAASRMRAKRSVALGRSEAIAEDFEKMIFKNARALDTFINLFPAGKAQVEPPIDPNRILRYYPVIVLIEGFPPYPTVRPYVSQVIRDRNLLQAHDIAPLSVLGIEDLETVAGFPSRTLAELLEGWQRLPSLPILTLGDYAAPSKGTKISQWFQSLQLSTFDDAARLVLGQPLPAVASPPPDPPI